MLERTGMNLLFYSFLLTLITVAGLVVLGNWLGLIGIILALLIPMAIEMLRSLLQIKNKNRVDKSIDT